MLLQLRYVRQMIEILEGPYSHFFYPLRGRRSLRKVGGSVFVRQGSLECFVISQEILTAGSKICVPVWTLEFMPQAHGIWQSPLDGIRGLSSNKTYGQIHVLFRLYAHSRQRPGHYLWSPVGSQSRVSYCCTKILRPSSSRSQR